MDAWVWAAEGSEFGPWKDLTTQAMVCNYGTDRKLANLLTKTLWVGSNLS